MVLGGGGERLRLAPRVVLGLGLGDMAFRRIAGIEIGAPPARLALGEKLSDQAAGAPARPLRRQALADRDARQRRDLLGALEILRRRALQPAPFQRHDALVARRQAVRLYGEGEVALAEQIAAGAVAQRLGVEARQRPQIGRRVEVDQQHVERPVALRLQLEAALLLQRRAEQHRQRRRLGDDAGDGGRVIVALQDGVERRPEPRHAPSRREPLDGIGSDDVVAGDVGDVADLVGHGASAPKHQASTPFCACSRFSASSNTTDAGPSITSSVTSSPRWAGRQCRKIASFAAWRISLALT